MDFLALPEARPLRLTNLTAPAVTVGASAPTGPVSLMIDADGRIAPSEGTAAAEVDMARATVLPAFVDAHTHLDKGHVWARAPNPDGTFMGALTTVNADRAARWTAADVRARAEFALKSAWAHGTRAIRTHLDSAPPQDAISWPLFEALREDWAGRIDLQMVCLVSVEWVDDDGRMAALADRVAAAGGALGCVTYPVEGIERRLDLFFRLAAERGLAADFHSDETMDPSSRTLEAVARAKTRNGFDGPAVCGHACSLSTMPEDDALRTLDLAAEAGVDLISLPLCNLYLQDRHAGRTPRNRGVALAQEAVARGIRFAFASDNTRDPFYAYGDLDMLEVMREATRIAHLDHGRADWAAAFTTQPAAICGFEPRMLAPGEPADLVICKGRSRTELLSRPQADRIVIRGGRQIDRTLPDYAELDHLMGPG